MSRHTHAIISLLATAGLALGCAGNSPAGDGDGDGDGDVVDPYGCESAPFGGEPFAIELGLRSGDASFVALSDGDELPVVLGFQGLYMSELELRAEILAPADADQVCFDCIAELGSGGSFAGIMQPEKTRFTEETDDLYNGFSTLLLGGHAQLEGGDAIEGLEVELAMTCEGHGFSGFGQRTVRLTVAE